jgi:hypothetical protein
MPALEAHHALVKLGARCTGELCKIPRDFGRPVAPLEPLPDLDLDIHLLP